MSYSETPDLISNEMKSFILIGVIFVEVLSQNPFSMPVANLEILAPRPGILNLWP